MSRAALLMSTLLLQAGCVGGLLGGGKPDALYRFGAPDTAMPAVQPVQPSLQRVVLLRKIRFAPEIEGDRLLTTRGNTALSIKGVRWVATVPDLFTQAMERSFATDAPEIRLEAVSTRDIAGYVLEVSVGRFEAHYSDDDPAAAPVALIEGDAALYSLPERKIVAARRFLTRLPASENRAPAVVAAFDRASALVCADLANWAEIATRDVADRTATAAPGKTPNVDR